MFSVTSRQELATRNGESEEVCTNQENRKHLKALIIETGLDKQVAKACRQSFAKHDRSDLSALEELHGESLVRLAKCVNNARYKRKQRVTERIGGCVTFGHCLFVTLTFTDETFSKTSEKTRRKYVSRYLKSQSAIYVANIDYGHKNQREHYHALVLADAIDLKPWHDYGAIQVERVKNSPDDLTKVAKYTAKLSNHAMKHNDGVAPRLIYSREKQAIKQFFAEIY